MYAIIQAKDRQYKVSEGAKLIVEKINQDAETDVNFDKVIFLSKGEEQTTTGTPYIEGASVQATVLKHFKSDKIIIFKKKRRKNHRKKQGHRQNYTLLKINKISNQ